MWLSTVPSPGELPKAEDSHECRVNSCSQSVKHSAQKQQDTINEASQSQVTVQGWPHTHHLTNTTQIWQEVTRTARGRKQKKDSWICSFGFGVIIVHVCAFTCAVLKGSVLLLQILLNLMKANEMKGRKKCAEEGGGEQDAELNMLGLISCWSGARTLPPNTHTLTPHPMASLTPHHTHTHTLTLLSTHYCSSLGPQKEMLVI